MSTFKGIRSFNTVRALYRPQLTRMALKPMAYRYINVDAQQQQQQQQQPLQPQPEPIKRKKGPKVFRWSFLLGTLLGVGMSIYQNSYIAMDSTEVRQLPTKCDPFPEKLSVNNADSSTSADFELLGVGVRTVSFLHFHVYGLGIYIASQDIAKARSLLASFGPSASDKLNSEEGSEEIIDALLKANVQLMVRIMPVRTTDFGHLRDGFVRSVTNHKLFKQIQNEEIGEGINELKRTFGRKRKVPKGDIITLVRDNSGALTAFYSLNKSQDEYELLGSVPNPMVSKLFFMQYLSGKSPNSPTACKSTHEALLTL